MNSYGKLQSLALISFFTKGEMLFIPFSYEGIFPMPLHPHVKETLKTSAWSFCHPPSNHSLTLTVAMTKKLTENA